ncbi:hypothetical protein [Nostoc sp. TCL26-01]|uniref:hypothetical protein n=1 Tax=Nostoc sp. TCL26-01 TaxID=2576904 RepID=UPI0015BB766C|nr:hypothetical protein [Nostoc sp. TCL26-01]QLE56720.1 hypothetical protein FD725_15125 [Nostoc sp. TCL26-01]
MSILNCTTLAATCLSLSLTLLTSHIANAQTQNLVIDDEFDAAFLILSSVDTVASHQVSSLEFGQTDASFNSNFDFFDDLKLTTNLQRSPSNSYDINFLLTTGSNSGFIPPGTTIGLAPVREWRLDISDFFSGSNNGIDFLTPVTYNSALGSWYDDGFLVFQTSYLAQLNDGSNPTQLAGQFEIGLRSGDLGAIGNGIDTFSLTINVTPIRQTTQEIPEYSSISALLMYTSLGLASAYKLKNQKGLFKQN